MAKIATILTDYFEDVEYLNPAQAFQNAGHEMETIEMERGKPVTGKQEQAIVTIDKSIEEVMPEEYDALFIPGGFSPDQLRADDRFVEFAKHFMTNKKPVFAICHGPQLLITAKSLEGRAVTGFKSIQTDLDYAGANVSDTEVVVCDNQLVTSREPADLPAFIEQSLELLR